MIEVWGSGRRRRRRRKKEIIIWRVVMAVGIGIEREGGQYNGKMTSFVVFSCMMAAMGGVLFGYDIGISGTLFSISISISFIVVISNSA